MNKFMSLYAKIVCFSFFYPQCTIFTYQKAESHGYCNNFSCEADETLTQGNVHCILLN